jgi:hypothetical protein
MSDSKVENKYLNPDKKPRCAKNLFSTPQSQRGSKQRAVEKAIFMDSGEDLTTNRERYLAEQKEQHISPFSKKFKNKG